MRHAHVSIVYLLTSALVGAGAVVFAHAGVVGIFVGQIVGALFGFVDYLAQRRCYLLALELIKVMERNGDLFGAYGYFQSCCLFRYLC